MANAKLLALLGAGAAYLVNRQMKGRSGNSNLWAEATRGMGAGTTSDLRFDNDGNKSDLRFDNDGNKNDLDFSK